ncbi:MAG: hypothetical protein Q8K72_00700 [Acidimicrobiales bacterium]|nr:hypothetical protein [Acidimicrobiales bacterium]
MGMVRDYRGPNEIHMEPGELHDPTNTVPPYPPELEAALARIARQDCSKLKGTEFDIVTRRLIRDGDTRYPLRSDERKVGIGATCQYVEY